MKITTFRNRKGLIHGSDPKRIGCDLAGVLKIGKDEIAIEPGSESLMPLLFQGGTGRCNACFTDRDGNVYTMEMEIKGGRVVPPSPEAVEMMELRCRLDTAEKECEELREDIQELRNIFDTNSLNFLIN